MADEPVDASRWDLRPDGTVKGLGYLGLLKRPGTDVVMSEFSVGVPIGGQEMDIPTFVPTLTAAEVQHLLTMRDGQRIPHSIIDKAVTHAYSRLAAGKPVFAEPGEQNESIHPQFPRASVRMPNQDIYLPNESGRVGR